MRDLRWKLIDNRRQLNKTKTEAFRSSCLRLPGVIWRTDVCGFTVPLKLTVRDISVVLDNSLDMSAQASNDCHGTYYNLFRIAKICALTMATRSCMAARVVLRVKRQGQQSKTAARQHLHWLPVKWCIKYKILVLVFCALHDRTLVYLASVITPYMLHSMIRQLHATDWAASPS